MKAIFVSRSINVILSFQLTPNHKNSIQHNIFENINLMLPLICFFRFSFTESHQYQAAYIIESLRITIFEKKGTTFHTIVELKQRGNDYFHSLILKYKFPIFSFLTCECVCCNSDKSNNRRGKKYMKTMIQRKESFTMAINKWRNTFNIILMLVVFINASTAIMEELSPGKWKNVSFHFI